MSKKVLIIAHGHPEFNKGGAEQAAYQFFHECLRQGDDAFFLARTSEPPHGGAAFSSIKTEREILFHTTHDDFFLFSNIKTRHLWGDFADLLEKVTPEVIYCHHYFLLGIELLKIIKNVLPNARLILTLHEYYAICHNGGLMIKTGEQHKLCYSSGPRECSRCFPDKSPGDFFLRQKYISQHFELVDKFIAPSKFLRQRYIDWGIAPNRIEVVENGQLFVQPAESADAVSLKVRIAYIGQINQYKGIDVLLDALNLLEDELLSQVIVDIHGANFDSQPDDFKSNIHKNLRRLKRVVRMHGAYEPQELANILSRVDWVVVPSIWWENSPMVIQEALNYRKPLIVSNIGGMAEKVQHQVTGLHFSVGNAVSLADAIRSVIDDRTLQQQYAANIVTPLTLSDAYTLLDAMI